MRPGYCMECGKEFDRANEKHGVVECINGMKARIKELEYDVVSEHQEAVNMFSRADELNDENAKLWRVVDAALEIEEILSRSDSRAEIDSFTVQPLTIALNEIKDLSRASKLYNKCEACNTQWIGDIDSCPTCTASND